jgi:hypothetical protein
MAEALGEMSKADWDALWAHDANPVAGTLHPHPPYEVACSQIHGLEPASFESPIQHREQARVLMGILQLHEHITSRAHRQKQLLGVENEPLSCHSRTDV